MAAVRNFSRLLTQRSLNKLVTRGYADQMKFTLAAGNQVFYDSKAVRQVDVPSFSGVFGILPMHVPTLAVLRPGVVHVHEDSGIKKIFVSSGTICINDDSSVQIIAEEACTLDQIDTAAAREILNDSNKALSSATTDVDRAEAAIAVEVAEELVKAATE